MDDLSKRRPAYPPATGVLARAASKYARTAILGVTLSALVAPAFAAASTLLGERAFFAAALFLVHSGTWLLINGGLLLADRLDVAAVTRCKIGRKKAETSSAELTRRLYLETALNHLVTSPLLAYYVLFPLAKWLGTPAPDAPLPGAMTQALCFVAAFTVNEWGFYVTHRLLHHRLLYATFHKKHHTWKGTVGAAAEYAHPLEVVLSNQLPTLGFMLLTGQHPLLQAVWLTLRLEKTYVTHSGFDFSDTLAARLGLAESDGGFHDHHHIVNAGNYGSELLDWAFGTMDSWVFMGGSDGYRARQLRRAAA